MIQYNIKDLLKKKYNGDSLSDKELMVLIQYTGRVANDLVCMGERYHLAFADIHSIYIECFDYAKNRGLVNLDNGYNLQQISQWIERNV
jgi:hypothetical protein